MYIIHVRLYMYMYMRVHALKKMPLSATLIITVIDT